MSEKELKMFDVNAQLDAAFGKEETSERKVAEDLMLSLQDNSLRKPGRKLIQQYLY